MPEYLSKPGRDPLLCCNCQEGSSGKMSSYEAAPPNYDASEDDDVGGGGRRRRKQIDENDGDVDDKDGCDVDDLSIAGKFKYFVQHTTFHGLDQVIESGSCLSRSFWLCIIIFVVIIVSIQLKSLLEYFLQNPTLTSINVVYPEEGLVFPNLTICTLTKINEKRLKSSYPEVSRVLAEYSTASFFSAFSTALMDFGFFQRKGYKIEELEKELDEVLGEDTNILNFINDVTFTCSDQFLLCWFENGHVFNCCDDESPFSIKRYLLHSGPCFQFETKVLRQQLPGPVGGFGFVYWYPNVDLFPSVFNSYDEHGVHLFTSPTDAMLEKNPISLQVGTHNHISLQATRTTRLSQDQLGRSTCVEKELKYFDWYSYPSCQAECLIEAMINQCNCTGLTTYGSIPPERICNPEQALICYQKLAYSFAKILISCRKEKCTEGCQYWTYKPSVTAGKVFNPKLEEDMIKYWRLPNNSDPSNSLIMADVYFPEIQFLDVEQKSALTIESFISSVGGAMGLWTGASIITWIHLVYFCCASCTALKRIDKKRRRNRQNRRAAAAAAAAAANNDKSISHGANNTALPNLPKSDTVLTDVNDAMMLDDREVGTPTTQHSSLSPPYGSPAKIGDPASINHNQQPTVDFLTSPVSSTTTPNRRRYLPPPPPWRDQIGDQINGNNNTYQRAASPTENVSDNSPSLNKTNLSGNPSSWTTDGRRPTNATRPSAPSSSSLITPPLSKLS